MDSGSLRHALATLAYRTARAIEDAPPEFARFDADGGGRTPERILAHMGDLMDWAISLVEGNQKWQVSAPLHWPEEAARFFRTLQTLDERLETAETVDLRANTFERLFQGPIGDALTHTGQLAMLRRMAGCPIRGENYFLANIAAGRVGSEQAPARKSF